MTHQRLLFEYSPFFIVFCLALGIGYAWVLYTAKHKWSRRVNQALFVVRTILVSILAFLLIGPILKLTETQVEKPALVFLVDNSLSVKETTDSVHLQNITNELDHVRKLVEDEGYSAEWKNLGPNNELPLKFDNKTSDLSGAIRTITADHEGKNLAGIVLVSDGIYNSGASPLYSTLKTPIYTIGVGDTAQRSDLVLKELTFNKIAYQGNKFPLRAEVLMHGGIGGNVNVSVYQGGKKVEQQIKPVNGKQLVEFDFKLDAAQKGLQRIDVVVDPSGSETNLKNNRASAFVEVVEGKKKILVIAPSPHPDIKALRSVVTKNSNYEFLLHIPGASEVDPSLLQPGNVDLIIFHQIGDQHGKTSALYNKLGKGTTSVLAIIGTGSSLRQLAANGIPLAFETIGQWDEVTPIVNPAYRDFGFSESVNTYFSKFPPISVPFGKFSYPGSASVLLSQRIGNVATDRPLALTYDDNGRKTGIIIGDGLWRWRLNEFSESEKSEAFDEVFSKLIQYLSTAEDRRKFRSFPVQNEFSDSEPVTFESQVYNDLFEQVYGNTIEMEIRDEQGKVSNYSYVTGAGSTRYRIGGLKEGVYKFRNSTMLNGKREEIRGEFLVIAQNLESQNLTADFGLLRKLADQTGGRFYTASQGAQLEAALKNLKAKGLIHSEEAFNPLINLKLVFFMLLALISAEWFLRKYLGSY